MVLMIRIPMDSTVMVRSGFPSLKSLVVFAGEIASGKTTIASLLAERLSWGLLSFRDFLSKELRSQHRKVNRAELQALGNELYKSHGEEWLLKKVLESVGKHSNNRFVLDGLRYPEGVTILKNTYGAACVVVYLKASMSVRAQRHDSRGSKSEKKLNEVLSSPTEQKVKDIEPLADITIETEGKVNDLVKLLDDYLSALNLSNNTKCVDDTLTFLPDKSLKVVCIGELTHDHYYQVERIPPDNQFANVVSHMESYGGHSANAACCFSSFGADVSIATQTAKDISPKLLDLLAHNGIRTDLIQLKLSSMPICLMFYKQGQSMNFYQFSSYYDIDKLWFHLSEFDLIHISGAKEFIPPFINALKREECRPFIIWNPGYETRFIEREIAEHMLELVTVITVNEEEVSNVLSWCGESKIFDGNLRFVIETCGMKGCIIYGKFFSARIPARNIPDVVTSFGAGDYLSAGFSAALYAGMNCFQACCLAMKVACVPLTTVVSHAMFNLISLND